MSKILVLLALLTVVLPASAESNPADYNVKIHVSVSSLDCSPFTCPAKQRLEVVIDGKKYELLSEKAVNALLVLGDYNAKLVQDEHKTAYDSFIIYEFRFADGKTRRFVLTGQSE